MSDRHSGLGSAGRGLTPMAGSSGDAARRDLLEIWCAATDRQGMAVEN